MSRNLTDGRWHKVGTKAEHETLLRYGKLTVRNTTDGSHARVQRGDYEGPGNYLELTYEQRCPRNCCDDLVRELLPPSEVIRQVRENMVELSDLLKAAKQ